MASHQAPRSLGFSRQEHWSGLPFPSPMHKSESEVAHSCPTLSDLMDCSLPGSSVHGIFQARVLEWGAIAFSGVSYLFNSNLLNVYTHVYKCFKIIEQFLVSKYPGVPQLGQFSRSVVSDSLRPHESQQARPPCPSPTPRVHPDSRPLSQ